MEPRAIPIEMCHRVYSFAATETLAF